MICGICGIVAPAERNHGIDGFRFTAATLGNQLCPSAL